MATAMNWDPVPALIQSFIRTKQRGLAGFQEMMNIRRNSSNNTVYADDNIADFYGLQYLASGDRPEGLSDMALINYFGMGSEPNERIRVFAETLRDLTHRYGDW